MKNWFRHLPVIILCTALFTGYAVKAQASKTTTEGDVSAKIRGNWALPDCKSYEEALIITRHFYLKSDKDGSQFWPLESLAKQKDYWVMSVEGKNHPVRIEADGVLKVGLLDKTPKKWPKTWDSLSMDGHREYMGCVETPAILPDPLVRVMKHIDEIADACHESMSQSCTKLLFNIADENKDGKISVKEMKTAAAMLASMSALIEYNTVTRAAMDKIVYQSYRETDRIAAWLMPKGREMSYGDFSGFLAQSDSMPLHEALLGVSPLIPGFKE
jgi:hypothetical protein